MKLKPGTKVRKTQCATCVFKDEKDGGIALRESRRTEIKVMLLKGTNQMCHHDDNKTICRGGRDFQLQCFARMGLIPEPADKALKEAMGRQT